MYGSYKYIVNDEQKKKDIEVRKEEIIRLLSRNSDAGAVIIRLSDGSKKVVSEKAYKIISLSALVQPKGKLEISWDDQYNNGPWLEIRDFDITPPQELNPSFLDKMKISKKIKTIEEIKTSKDPLYDKKGKIKIKIFPVSHREVGGYLPGGARGDYESRTIIPEEIDCFEYEITPRELAEVGIDYKELDWEEIQEKKSDNRENSLKDIRVTPSEMNGNEQNSGPKGEEPEVEETSR